MAFFYRGGSSQLKAKKSSFTKCIFREGMPAFLQFASPLPNKEKKKKSFQTWGHLICSGHYPNTLHAS